MLIHMPDVESSLSNLGLDSEERQVKLKLLKLCIRSKNV